MSLELRPEVAAFAQLMEQKLRENDHKGGWRGCTTGYLSRRCGNELDELRVAVHRFNDWPRGTLTTGELALVVAQEAADVANFAMMLADVCGALKATP